MQAAYKMVSPTGGRVTVFQHTLPTIGKKLLQWFTVGQNIQKSPGQKNSWNQINQFHEFFFDQIPFFAISKMAKNQFLNWEKV